MSRSSWKGDIELNLSKFYGVQRVRIYDKGLVILPEYVGKSFDIHTGNGFYTLTVLEDMVGMRFGEFAFTREVKPAHHMKRKRKLIMLKRKGKSKSKLKSKRR